MWIFHLYSCEFSLIQFDGFPLALCAIVRVTEFATNFLLILRFIAAIVTFLNIMQVCEVLFHFEEHFSLKGIFFSIENLFSNHLRIKFKTYHGKFPLEIDSVNENEASKLCAWKGLWKLISKCNKFSHFWLLQRIKRLLKWAFFSET